MDKPIDAILFDMGETLRTTTKREREERLCKIRTMLDLLEIQGDEVEFKRLLGERSRAYKKWAERTLREANEVELWTRWMLPDQPAERVGRHALQLNRLWREVTGIRTPFPETREVLLELFRRGYRLGLVSNTVTSVEVPNLFKDLGLTGYIDAVVLSCVVGIRKPDPAILLLACERMGVRPERCAYIGDRPDRDTAAARRAGFASSVILRNRRKPGRLPQGPDQVPDHFIDNLKELLEIFPARSAPRQAPAASPVYAASLSTLWVKGNFATLDHFFLAAGRLGFSGVELNHQMNTELLSGVDLARYTIGSLHEPCPSDIAVETLKERDWLISSTDEECRRQGVAAVKRSLELAARLSVRRVVVHSGHVLPEMTREKKLRRLFQEGLTGSAEYEEIRQRMLAIRREQAGPHLEAVRRSLKELLELAGQLGLCLGLENRYHYNDIPTQDELADLLTLAGPERLGFIYDVGHATAMDRLGFLPGRGWLERFGTRIVGTHLHDVIGLTDHQAPGLGDVDFRQVAGYLPAEAFRTVEVLASNTPEQLRAGLKILYEAGCIRQR